MISGYAELRRRAEGKPLREPRPKPPAAKSTYTASSTELWHQADDRSWFTERNGQIIELDESNQAPNHAPMIDGYAELRANARKGAQSS